MICAEVGLHHGDVKWSGCSNLDVLNVYKLTSRAGSHNDERANPFSDSVVHLVLPPDENLISRLIRAVRGWWDCVVKCSFDMELGHLGLHVLSGGASKCSAFVQGGTGSPHLGVGVDWRVFSEYECGWDKSFRAKSVIHRFMSTSECEGLIGVRIVSPEFSKGVPQSLMIPFT